MKVEGGNNFNMTGELNDPSEFDYDIRGFHKKRTIVKGELVKIEYYRNYDGTNYSDLIVEETRQYTRDTNLLVQYRTQVSKWFLEDGITMGLEKTFIKYYSMNEAIAEGLTRRGNMLSDAKLYILYSVGLANGQDLMITYATEMTAFINGFAQVLKDAIMNSTKIYLTQNIKNATVSILSY